MLYIHKKGFSHKALNILKRMAAFHNPEFYKAQAMRLSTYGKPRVFSCSDDLGAYLALPRGCESDLRELVQKHTLNAEWVDEMQNGQFIQAEFKGVLRAEQQRALNAMIEHRTGVLSATTAFGKTVVAAALIAARKVNTLVLVHRQQLLAQWVTRLTDFLVLPEETPDKVSKKGKKPEGGPHRQSGDRGKTG